ncbi:LPXTG cell wall anchor domain-containing protein [Listeria monocytogenes]|nr:LPXTG cell wall anchor domain-containing protein [Listeria monocytogenes]
MTVNAQKLPKTGDQSMLGWLILGSSLSLFSLYLLKNIRKFQSK